MKILRILGFSFLIAIPLHAEPLKPVALVYSLAGKVETAGRPLRLFDRLPAGATLKVGTKSRLALAFGNGLIYELGEGSSVTLGTRDLASRKGPVRALPRVPTLPPLSPISAKDHPGPRAGAVRIRSEEIENLYPGYGATALASAVILRFQKINGADRYGIEIEDRQGTVVYSKETVSTELRLPADILLPGVSYYWNVRTIDRSGPGSAAWGEAGFTTLDAETVRMREELRLLAEKSDGGDLTALLAGVDRHLGLFAEARAELRSALSMAPGDAALGEALTALEQHMENTDDAAEN